MEKVFGKSKTGRCRIYLEKDRYMFYWTPAVVSRYEIDEENRNRISFLFEIRFLSFCIGFYYYRNPFSLEYVK